MSERMYRTQILLESEQHRTLSQIAKREGRSISDVVRQMIRQQLGQEEVTRQAGIKKRLEDLEEIQRHREEMLKARGGKPIDFDVVEAINQAREEQDERNWSILTGSDS